MIKVYCGQTVDDRCEKSLHPVTEVNNAIRILEANEDISIYSNDTDFVAAMKHIGNHMGVEVEFFLDDVSQGDDIDNIFEDFNRAINLINERSQ